MSLLLVAVIAAGPTSVVLGAYALAWRVMRWNREDEARWEALLKAREEEKAEKVRAREAAEKGERMQCPAIKTFTFANAGHVTARCELEHNHRGPHFTCPLPGAANQYWE